MKYTGNNPTLLYAYGGFEVPRLPSYSAILGTAWLENGGVYVLQTSGEAANLVQSWHQAGLKENRQRVYDDFYAVAENLIEQKITKRPKNWAFLVAVTADFWLVLHTLNALIYIMQLFVQFRFST
jgi:prolyl oligopeptidase